MQGESDAGGTRYWSKSSLSDQQVQGCVARAETRFGVSDYARQLHTRCCSCCALLIGRTARSTAEAMPLYVVRWPDLSACIVRARDEEDLHLILDELADPTDCKHWIYNGPLWVEFELPVTMVTPTRADRLGQPLLRDQITLEGIEDYLKECGGLRLTAACADTATEMERAVMERCFPVAAKALDEALTRLADDDEPPHADEMRAIVDQVKEALLRELDRYIAGSWHAAARWRSD